MFSQLYTPLQEALGRFLASDAPWECPDFPVAPSFEEALDGLRPGAPAQAIIEAGRAVRQERFGGAILPVVPVYGSSICAESCLYCNYRRQNKEGVERVRLSDGELEREMRFLVQEKGYRVLELVYASDPGIRAEDIARHTCLARGILQEAGGGVVGLNGPVMEEEGYRLLVDAGIGFVALWQETYDRARFAALHPPPGQKPDFEGRLDVFDRMRRAGIRHVGLGVLLGLADWRRDWGMLMLHGEYLRRLYGEGPAVLGIPRLKHAPGAVKLEGRAPPDLEFRLAVALHQKAHPDCLPFVNTREAWDLCVELARGGGCLFTFNCSTIPGGYTRAHRGSQFFSHDFDGPEFAARAREEGLHPVLPWARLLPECSPAAT